MTLAATTIGDIVNNATPEDLHRIEEAIKSRRQLLANMTASQLAAGQRVRITQISPRYLEGMRGTVMGFVGGRSKRWTVQLDEVSTAHLRRVGGSRFYIPDDTKNYTLTGVLPQCLVILDEAATA